MITLSVAVITYNEERNIDRCLSSVQGIADELIVVDSFSTDRTREICERYGARVIERKFEGHIQQKNFALEQASSPYVLSLDADEALSSDLKESILSMKNHWTNDAYEMSRLTNYCGSWIRHSGWYPDRKVRLLDKRRGRWSGENPHDRISMDEGSTLGRLKGDILHYSYYTLSDHVRQIDYFTDISARTLYAKGRRPSMLRMLAGPWFRFFRDYVLKLGFLDGYHGLVICAMSSQAVFIKYAKLRQLYETR